jgi:hypothetical protein
MFFIYLFIFLKAHVVEDAKAKKVVDYSDVASRFDYASGSFFDSVPSGAGTFLL